MTPILLIIEINDEGLRSKVKGGLGITRGWMAEGPGFEPGTPLS